MRNRILSFIFVLVFLTCGICFTSIICVAEDNSIKYITNTEEFLDALQRGNSVIYVDNLSFDRDTRVQINNNVNIIGKKEKSTIEKGNFVIHGPNGLEEKVDVKFENVIFDGLIRKENYDFSTPDQPFEDIFGGSLRTDKRCIEALDGYFDITLINCEITGYASYDAPAIYVNNNEAYRGADCDRDVTLDRCKIYRNICYGGTVMLSSDIGKNTINNSVFTENLAKSASGMVLVNGTSSVENTLIKNNDYYHFLDRDHPNDKRAGAGTRSNREFNYMHSTGAIYVGGNANVKNCEITGNRNVFGGGVGVVNGEANSKIDFVNCVIADNKADLCGGAIYAQSQSGQSINFINCSIFGNQASQGGILYTTTLVPDNNRSMGGIVSFLFCTIADNEDEDAKSFSFRDLVVPEAQAWRVGTIELKGCFVIDNTPYTVEGNYNYVATKDQALLDNVITAENYDDIREKGLYPISESVADIEIDSENYSTWHSSFENLMSTRKNGSNVFAIAIKEEIVGNLEIIGEKTVGSTLTAEIKDGNIQIESAVFVWKRNNTIIENATISTYILTEEDLGAVISVNVTDGLHYGILESEQTTEIEKPEIEEEPEKDNFPYWTLVFPVTFVVGGIIFLIIVLVKKKRQKIEQDIIEDEDIEEKSAIDFASYEMETLIDKLAKILRDKKLTKRELQIAALLLQFVKRKDIAEKLFVSEDTVKTHISHIFKKLDISSRREFREYVEGRFN